MIKYIGYHTNIYKSLLYTLKNTKVNILQFFIQDIINDSTKELQEATKYAKNNNILLVIHSSYMINIAKNFDTLNFHIKALIREFEIADKIKNIYGIVVHMGKSMELPINIAINNMFMTIIYILNKTKNIILLLETPAGQGTEMCSNCDDFIKFYKKFNKYDRVKICIDSCHVFAAGYDPCDYINKIINECGEKSIALIHLNDSKTKKNSKKDRHAVVGQGYIKNLDEFIKIITKYNIPTVSEW